MKMIGTLVIYRLAALVLAVVLAASACGASGDGVRIGSASSAAADVEVVGVQQGCADVLDIAERVTGSRASSLTPEDLVQMNRGIDRARASFSDAPDDARRYLELLDNALGDTAREVSDRDQPNGDQIALLLGVELAANGAEFERVSSGYNRYMDSTCGAVADERGAASSSSATAAATSVPGSDADNAASDPVAAETVIPPTPITPAPITPTPTPVPPPEPFIDIDASSAGATGTFLLIDFEVGEIWRTNVDPAAALSGTDDTIGTEEEFVLVELRLTSTGAGASFRPNNFGWFDSSGLRTAAISTFESTGNEADVRVAANESFTRYLVFPGTVELAAGAVLQVLDGDATPENIPLAAGVASNAYPVTLATGEAGSATYMSTASNCSYPYETEIRDAVVSLDGVDRQFVLRASEGKRFLTLEVALDVLAVEGQSCAWATTVYLNGWDVRLQLDNGDVIAPYYFDGRAEVGATELATITFSFPAGVTAADFIDIDGTVLASWTDLNLPDA